MKCLKRRIKQTTKQTSFKSKRSVYIGKEYFFEKNVIFQKIDT